MVDMSCMWFMQDGARPHRTQQVFDVLNQRFAGRHVESAIEWPPYSPDLNPCDFWLWGSLKDKIYRNRIANLAQRKTAIINAIDQIDTENVLPRVFREFEARLMHIVEADGGHFEN